MSSPYIFEPLNPVANEIRLLRLLPGQAAEPVRCTLHVVSLDASPRYEALSYVWGDAAKKHDILVDGQRYDITVNLEAALRGLRRSFRSRQLWADAICINQDDTDDKNKQIPEMARIYSQASRVLVWLGEPSNAIRTAVSWVNRYRSGRPFLHHMKVKTLSWFSTTAAEVYRTELERAVWGILEVFAHLYWTRMWTFQEYTLARTSPLLVWRSLKIPGDTLHRAGTTTTAMLHQCYVDIAQLYDGTTNFLTGEPCGEDMTISLSSIQKSIVRAELLHYPLRRRLNNDLLSLLRETSVTRVCSDPRDYVYALYGLLPDLRRACPADYSNSEQEVMHDTAVYLARRGDLSGVYRSYTLYDNRLCSGSASSTLAPSWVPDLTRPFINFITRALGSVPLTTPVPLFPAKLCAIDIGSLPRSIVVWQRPPTCCAAVRALPSSHHLF